jgi:hypothetical protein
MARMTEEEAFALDEKWTKMDPKVGPNGSGFFTQKRKTTLSVTVDDLSAKWLLTKATSSSKTPSEIINEMVREKIAVAM